ncbi:hypothetical protein ACFVW5_09105 [Streptomyces sp. NPDC058232]|uniref:hypothetical protein n=1 Tax=Streptomyces sp. NPDC058232 TaxID=3346393 RepID=UPI0036E18877
MKSRSVYRAHPDHASAAALAREERGHWVMAALYPSSSSAKTVARRVPIAEMMPAYEPAGAYEAYAARHTDGTALWVRYVAGDEPVPVLPDRMSVRIRHDGDGPGYSGIGIITLTVSTRCSQCGGPRGFDTVIPHRFHHDGDWYVADRWANKCGHVDMYDAVLAESREVLLPLVPAPVPLPSPPADDSPAGLILAAAKLWRGMHATQAAQMLDVRGHGEYAERIRAELRSRNGHMSAKQAADLLHALPSPVAEGGVQ